MNLTRHHIKRENEVRKELEGRKEGRKGGGDHAAGE